MTLTERLRDNRGHSHAGGCQGCFSSVMDDAADHIEELLTALKAAREKLQIVHGGWQKYEGGMPTQFLFPLIDAAIANATAPA